MLACHSNIMHFFSVSRKLGKIYLLCASIAVIVMLFASDIYKMIRDNWGFNYTMGGNMINYSAGFVRRGLFGEIIQSLNYLVQPFLSEILLSAISLLFIFYIIITRTKTLNVKFIYLLAIIFSPSLFLLHRGEEIFRTDAVVMALNFAASCVLLNKILIGRKISYLVGGGKTTSRIFILDFVILLLLTASALIHELSFFLLPPVMLLFFIYCRKNHTVMHFIFVLDIILIIYVVMMLRFTFSDPDTITKSWSDIFGDSAAYRNNGGLTNVVDKNISPKGPPILIARVPGLPIILLFNLFVAVIPFIFLLISGIKFFQSPSSRSRRIRKILAMLCMTPILLSPIAGDYGRWFSICAFNLVVYSLLTAHPAKMKYSNNSCRKIEKIKGLVKQFIVLVIAIALINYRLRCDGYFYNNDQTIFEETNFIAANFQNLSEYIKQLLMRDLVIIPWWPH